MATRTRTDGTRASIITGIYTNLVTYRAAESKFAKATVALAALDPKSDYRDFIVSDQATQATKMGDAIKTLHGLHEKLVGDGENFITTMLRQLEKNIGDLSATTQSQVFSAFPEIAPKDEKAEMKDVESTKSKK